MLVIEDELPQAYALSAALEANGFASILATTGSQALDLIQRAVPDVILLDLGLPDVDGVELCRHLKVQLPAIPVIVVTANGTDDSMISALDIGADDYVVKPLSVPVLLARVRVALRHLLARGPLVEGAILTCGDLAVDLAGREVRVDGVVIDLLPRQFDLLVALLRNEGKLMTYRTLVRACWGLEQTDDRLAALRTSMSKLRKALGTSPNRPTILTQHQVGYRLVGP